MGVVSEFMAVTLRTVEKSAMTCSTCSPKNRSVNATLLPYAGFQEHVERIRDDFKEFL